MAWAGRDLKDHLLPTPLLQARLQTKYIHISKRWQKTQIFLTSSVAITKHDLGQCKREPANKLWKKPLHKQNPQSSIYLKIFSICSELQQLEEKQIPHSTHTHTHTEKERDRQTERMCTFYHYQQERKKTGFSRKKPFRPKFGYKHIF